MSSVWPGQAIAQAVKVGYVNVPALAQEVTVLDDVITPSSMIFAQLTGNDATALYARVKEWGTGTVTFRLNAATTAITRLNYFITGAETQ